MSSDRSLLRVCVLLIISLAVVGGGCSNDRTTPPGSSSTSASEETRADAGEQRLWTCGMHPGVVEEEPGRCPICGMELTPVSSGRSSSKAASEVSGGTSAAGEANRRGEAKGEREIAYWVAPMDPTYISDSPGKSPMGMDLVPVYEDETGGTGDGGPSVVIDPVVVQNMGVRVEPVRRQTLFRHLRTIGEVETAEDAMSVVNLRFSGWIEKIHVDKTGEAIEAGEPLFEIYSPELVAAQDEYLLALRTRGSKSSLTRSARRKLDLFGLDPRDVRAMERAGEARRTVPIRAPRAGFVLHKNVVEGARVPAGQDLYSIGDLSRIWVKAEIYEHDAPWVSEGQAARMELSYQRGVQIDGKVAYVYPTLNETSRTLSVRLEFPNPDLRLKPGMFATVYIEFRRIDDAIVVPTAAVIHSGKRELVFVAAGGGHFEAREITTGLVGDRRLTQVLSGLEPGERVVTSGQFLIDSESQLQEAIAKMRARRSGEGEPRGEDDEPRRDELYACPMHPEQISHEPGRCEVCGMDLELRSATPEEMARLQAREPGADAGTDGADETPSHDPAPEAPR